MYEPQTFGFEFVPSGPWFPAIQGRRGHLAEKGRRISARSKAVDRARGGHGHELNGIGLGVAFLLLVQIGCRCCDAGEEV